MRISESSLMTKLRSLNELLISIQIESLANLGPMLSATSSPVKGFSYSRILPSGNVILIDILQ